MKKNYLLICSAIIWLIIIFLFSNSTSNHSNQLSYSVIDKLITITNKLNVTNIEDENRYIVIQQINKPIRKLAHMAEYFILAFLMFHILTSYRIKRNRYIITFILCFLYAMTDEYHQIMIEGRNGQFIDCIIDSIGCLIYLTGKYFKEQIPYKFK